MSKVVRVKQSKVRLAAWGVVLVVGMTFLTWLLNPGGPQDAALMALESGQQVSVSDEGDWVLFLPAEQRTETGFIFYPGGRVDYRSYAPLTRAVAEAGYPVVLVKMPLSLAVFDPMRAERVMAEISSVQKWVIGGHSLGGAMAASFVHANPQAVDGLIFYAAYPAQTNPLTGVDIPIASIYATLDGLATTEKIEQSRALLPQTASFVAIEGGNHAQFGWYGAQEGDGEATLSHLEQQAQMLRATLDLLSDVEVK